MMDIDSKFMQEAIKVAKDAESIGEVPIAAIIVKDGKIISTGHNRREIDKDPTAHAEVVAIRKAAEKLGDWRLEGCTIYVTVEPCAMCAGALWLSRVDRCVYGCKEPRAGFLGSVGDISACKQLNHHYEVTGGVMAEECATILREFFLRIRQAKKKKSINSKVK
jgi:tRNA(adenine34) deaminase